MKEYSNGIFPRNLCITRSIDEANELFICPFTDDGKFEYHETAYATTYPANFRDKEKGCVLLLINTDINIKTICHEAFHITLKMLEYLPCELSEETEEVWAYTIGWVAGCIDNYIKEESK